MTEVKKLTFILNRYPRTTAAGIGILTAFGLILYEKHRLGRFISKLVTPPTQELDKKRPDYIYIKYHIYKESMRKLKQKEEQDKKWISVIINPIGKWWKSAKHSVAWRLLKIAQTGTQHERLKAISQLSSIDHLKDWDFWHLAQLCDARTAVSLARSGADLRWFLPVHKRGFIKNPKAVLYDLYTLLSKLRPNSCVDHFFSKHFPEQLPINKVDEFLYAPELSYNFSVQDTDMLKEIISFMHHITKDPKVCLQILNDGGLVHLMELKKLFAGDNETLSTLCKILANISLVDGSVEHFFASGWISTLAELQQCPDLRLQVISAKAMANLDHDDPNRSEYPPNVYPLHPRLRTRRKPKADIVFIHGLLGGVFITWRQKDRKPMEIGLYGRNAFYTSQVNDVFMLGEQRRASNGKNGYKNLNGTSIDTSTPKIGPVLKTQKKHEAKHLEISDTATKELVETLQNSAELDSDWEVVHPDVPLKANENCQGEFSVSGSDWENQDFGEDYTNCWPMEWLPDDYPNARIIGIDYTSALTEWSANFTKYCPCEKGQGHIDIRASSLLERIAKSDVGNDRPVVWIGHSMGGILTKMMLLKSIDHDDPQVQQISKNTTGIVFLGTPHRGSPIAKWKQHMQMILSPSIEVKEMEEDSPKLLELHNRFMHSLHTTFHDIKVVSIAEGTPTMLTTFKFPLHIVTEESARIDYGDFYILKDDHLSLSKPVFRQSFLYKRLLKVIDAAINQSTEPENNNQLPHTQINEVDLKYFETESSKPAAESPESIFALFPKITFKFPTSSIDA